MSDATLEEMLLAIALVGETARRPGDFVDMCTKRGDVFYGGDVVVVTSNTGSLASQFVLTVKDWLRSVLKHRVEMLGLRGRQVYARLGDAVVSAEGSDAAATESRHAVGGVVHDRVVTIVVDGEGDRVVQLTPDVVRRARRILLAARYAFKMMAGDDDDDDDKWK